MLNVYYWMLKWMPVLFSHWNCHSRKYHTTTSASFTGLLCFQQQQHVIENTHTPQTTHYDVTLVCNCLLSTSYESTSRWLTRQTDVHVLLLTQAFSRRGLRMMISSGFMTRAGTCCSDRSNSKPQPFSVACALSSLQPSPTHNVHVRLQALRMAT